jgi:hypothetical protein
MLQKNKKTSAKLRFFDGSVYWTGSEPLIGSSFSFLTFVLYVQTDKQQVLLEIRTV